VNVAIAHLLAAPAYARNGMAPGSTFLMASQSGEITAIAPASVQAMA
jgi:hypothetical protein